MSTRERMSMLNQNEEPSTSSTSSTAQPYTTHGLDRLCVGNPKQRIASCVLLVSFGALILIPSLGLVVKFQERHVYLEARDVVANPNYFPAITFCINRETKDKYCEQINDANYSNMVGYNCIWVGNSSRTRPRATNNSMESRIWDEHLLIGCNSRENDCKPDDVSFKYVRWQNYSRGNCFTWNYEGKFYSRRNKIEFQVGLVEPPGGQRFIEMILHDHEEYPFLKPSIRLSTKQDYQIILLKTKIARLPAPMKSKCVNTTKDYHIPGKYTVYNCFESIRCIDALKNCGDTYDFCKDYLPKELLRRYHNIRLERSQVWNCLDNGYVNNTEYYEKCPPQCLETIFGTSTYMYKKNQNTVDNISNLMFQYMEAKYMLIEEKELYNFKQLLGEIGGISGIIAGISVLTCFESLLSFCLKCKLFG